MAIGGIVLYPGGRQCCEKRASRPGRVRRLVQDLKYTLNDHPDRAVRFQDIAKSLRIKEDENACGYILAGDVGQFSGVSGNDDRHLCHQQV